MRKLAEVNVGDLRGRLTLVRKGPELNEYRYVITRRDGTIVHDINLLVENHASALEVMLQELAIHSEREDVAELLWNDSVRNTARAVRYVVRALCG